MRDKSTDAGQARQPEISVALQLGEPVAFRQWLGGLIRFDQLEHAAVCRTYGPQPDNPRVYEAEFYCPATDCDVREVRLTFKDFDRRPKAVKKSLRCPVCDSPLKFHGCISRTIFIPADEVDDADQPVIVGGPRPRSPTSWIAPAICAKA
jgi:hypothetical protein